MKIKNIHQNKNLIWPNEAPKRDLEEEKAIQKDVQLFNKGPRA